MEVRPLLLQEYPRTLSVSSQIRSSVSSQVGSSSSVPRPGLLEECSDHDDHPLLESLVCPTPIPSRTSVLEDLSPDPTTPTYPVLPVLPSLPGPGSSPYDRPGPFFTRPVRPWDPAHTPPRHLVAPTRRPPGLRHLPVPEKNTHCSLTPYGVRRGSVRPCKNVTTSPTLSSLKV